MALVRVYCGLASAEPTRPADQRHSPNGIWLTVAIVDDSGRLLEVCDISDDPAGYAHLGVVLAERSTGPTGVAIAADSDDHLVTTLLMAAGRPLAFADDDSVDDYAERFADDESVEEMESPPAERRAVGLARALQAGALSAVALPAPREVAALKPVLAAHAALAVGRQAAAVALREVLRELYPAALRAYPDPAEAVPLAVLDALPEPGMVGGSTSARSREAAAAADGLAGALASAGVADVATIAEAITALRVAIAETPRRGGVSKGLTTAVASTVRHAVATVRACDAAQAALIGALAERGNAPVSGARPRVVRQRSAGSTASSTPLRAVREATAEHPTVRVAGPRRNRPSAAPAAPVMPVSAPPLPRRPAAVAMPVSAPPLPRRPAAAAMPVSAPPLPRRPAAAVPAAPAVPAAAAAMPVPTPPLPRRPAAAAVSSPPADRPAPPPPPGITPIVPLRGPAVPSPSHPVSPAQPAAPAYFPPAPGHHLPPGVEPFRTTVTTGASGGYGPTEYTTVPTGRPAAPVSPAAPPGSRPNWPLSGGADAPMSGLAPDPILGDPYAGVGLPSADRGSGRVVPPWQADDLQEPAPLRLVEPPPLSDPALRLVEPPPLTDPALRLVEPPPLTDPALRRDDPGANVRFDPPALRLVDSSALDGGPLSAPSGSPTGSPVPADESDSDLLIFSATRSAWFSNSAPQIDWTNPNDAGWRAAEQAARPSFGEATMAGLPKRVPQANLVPGAPLVAPDRPLHIIRDAASIAANTAGYFRGWRRGQEIGGYAVGGRPGRESPNGWHVDRDQPDGYDLDSMYDYQPAAYPSR